MRNEKLKPKGDGTYYLPKRKRADGSEYVPAQYKNVDKKCVCNESKGRYCTNFLGSPNHSEHICVKCGGIMFSS